MTNGFGIYKGSKSEVTGVNEKKNGMALVTIPFTDKLVQKHFQMKLHVCSV